MELSHCFHAQLKLGNAELDLWGGQNSPLQHFMMQIKAVMHLEHSDMRLKTLCCLLCVTLTTGREDRGGVVPGRESLVAAGGHQSTTVTAGKGTRRVTTRGCKAFPGG